MTEEDSDKIDQYLEGSLPPGELTTFEEKLRADEVLARRVALRREMYTAARSGEAELKNLLQETDKAHYTKPATNPSPTTSPFQKWWWLLLVLPLLIAAFLLWRNQEDQLIIPAPDTPTDTITPPPVPTADSILPTTPSEGATPPEVNPPEVSPSEQKTLPQQNTQPPERPVYAALDPTDFVANPLLEDLISGGLRSGLDSTSIIISPTTDTIRISQLATASVAGYSTVTPPYEILLFDNQTDNFLEDRPLVRSTLAGTPQEDAYNFKVLLSAIEQPGRYYLLVMDKDEELLAGKLILVR